MAEQIIQRDFLLMSYYEARNTLEHEQAVAQVAGETGQAVETVEAVIQEETV